MVVKNDTRVVSERHDAGGVNIVVSGPRLAEKKAEEREKAEEEDILGVDFHDESYCWVHIFEIGRK